MFQGSLCGGHRFDPRAALRFDLDEILVVPVAYNGTALLADMLGSLPADAHVLISANASTDSDIPAKLTAQHGACVPANSKTLLLVNPYAQLASDCLKALVATFGHNGIE